MSENLIDGSYENVAWLEHSGALFCSHGQKPVPRDFRGLRKGFDICRIGAGFDSLRRGFVGIGLSRAEGEASHRKRLAAEKASRVRSSVQDTKVESPCRPNATRLRSGCESTLELRESILKGKAISHYGGAVVSYQSLVAGAGFEPAAFRL